MEKRVLLTDLPSLDAEIGTRVWVERIGWFEAVPRDQAVTFAIAGPTDALTPISWQPNGGSFASLFGGGNTAAVALGLDASSPVLAQTLSGLGNSKVYVARFGIRVTIWKDATKAHCGNMDCTIDAHIATNGAGVATVTFATTPYFDASLLIAGLAGAAATVAASAGGFTVSATRVAGVACSAVAAWWCVTMRDIT